MISIFLLNMLMLGGLVPNLLLGVTLGWPSIRSSGGGGLGGGVEMLLAASCYRNEPDITTVLMGRLTRMQTLLCKIIIRLKNSTFAIEAVILPKQQVHQ